MKHLLLTTIAAVVVVGCGESIHKAALDGNIEAVKKHLAAGTDVNAKDKHGGAPLYHAAGYGHKEIVELLIAKGADVNVKIVHPNASFHPWNDGHTPLDNAKHKPEIVDLLRKHGGKTIYELSIWKAAFGGSIEAIKQHIAAGTDVNAKDTYGWTPLNHAVEGGHKEIAELLIAKGADVNSMTRGGDTPLDWADDEIADLLRKHGGKTGEELKAEGK
jgi:ankyrin repeat protein